MTRSTGTTEPMFPSRPDAAPAPAPLSPSERDPGLWQPRLMRILGRQRDLYIELQRLGARQSAAVADDDSDTLLDVLAQKQGIIDELTSLNHEVTPFVHRWNEISTVLTEKQREELRLRFDEVGRLVDDIQARDLADRKSLEARRESVGAELHALTRARGAATAYRAIPNNTPRYQDRQG